VSRWLNDDVQHGVSRLADLMHRVWFVTKTALNVFLHESLCASLQPVVGQYVCLRMSYPHVLISMIHGIDLLLSWTREKL